MRCKDCGSRNIEPVQYTDDVRTHQKDHVAGVMRQIVSPEELRDILNEQGRSCDRPMFFRVRDEWRVAK